MSERAERKAWVAAAAEAAEFAATLPEDDADRTPKQRAHLAQLMTVVHQAADRHHAVKADDA